MMKWLRCAFLIGLLVLLSTACTKVVEPDTETESVVEPVLEETVSETEEAKTYITEETTRNGVDYTYIAFDDMVPEGYTLNQCWNGIGMADDGTVFIGWTSMREDGREDFVVYSYDPSTQERKFIGTMMQASEAAGNLAEDEEIPKGHTEIIQVGTRMYMASQSFHDFKEEIDDLPNYRGAHLYAYDMETETFSDITADLPGGVAIEHEGIVALTYKEDTNELLGLTHPHSSIVFFDIDLGTVTKIVEGIPWSLGNPLSRELIVDKKGMIYTYRGTENPPEMDQSFNMWIYDTKTETLIETDQTFSGGFWSGQAATADGETVYISTVNGKLFSLDTNLGTVTDLGLFIPNTMKIAKIQPYYLYDITLSNDEKYIYALAPAEYGNLFRYNIEKGIVTQVANLPDDIYSSNNLMDDDGRLYFAKFQPWEGQVRLMILDPGRGDSE